MATYNGIFIRAPGIVSLDNKEKVKILASLPYDFDSKMQSTIKAGMFQILNICQYHDFLCVQYYAMKCRKCFSNKINVQVTILC